MASLSFLVILCTFSAAYGVFPSVTMTALPHVLHSTRAHSIHTAALHSSSVHTKNASMVKSATKVTPTPSPIKFSTAIVVSKNTTIASMSTAHSSRTSHVVPTSTVAPTHKPTTIKPTTIKPTSVVPPKKAKDFNWQTKGNKTCNIKMRAVIKMDVKYMKKDNMTDIKTLYIDEATKGVMVSGSCENVTRVLVIAMRDMYKLSFTFIKAGAGVTGVRNSAQEWKQTKLGFYYNTTAFPNSTGTPINKTVSGEFCHSNVDTFYQCNSGLVVNGANVTNFDFTLFKVQPFAEHLKNKTEGGFGEGGGKCKGDIKPTPTPTPEPDNDIVPIAVGCALAGLVVIVLIAYIIGRRRTHRGYQQV